MSDETTETKTGNPSSSDALAPAATGSGGTAKVYQAIALSAAIAVQDATESLRNAATIANTAIGVAFSQMLATGDAKTYGAAIDKAHSVISGATKDLQSIGTAAASLLKELRPGTPPGPSK